MHYRRYRVLARHKAPLLEFLTDALESCGCAIISRTPPDEAPFRVSFEAPGGERLGILCYAFFANSKATKNRPIDEHRFQVKYGPKDDKRHRLFRDPFGLYTTLFLGINPDRGFFVGADATLHSPTRFYISVEFKERHVERVLADGWHAWERDRRSSDSSPIEVLVGGRPARFLDYVRFERAAEGLDQGHRQLLAEKIWPPFVQAVAPPLVEVVPPARRLHALAEEFELSEGQILDLIGSARRLKMAVRGWVAEEHLVATLRAVPDVTDCCRIDDEGGADVVLRYRGSEPIAIECKNVARQRAANGDVRLDFQRTRSSKADPCSRFYRPDDFDLVAACLHAVSERWEFRYATPHTLDPHKVCKGRLSHNVRLDNRWLADAAAALEAAASG